MIVSIRAGEKSGPTATLVDGENLRQFHVEIDGVSDADAAEALRKASLGRFADRQTAWISIAVVRKHFAGALGPAWVRQFASTVEYAAHKGWRSEDEQYLQTHVVRLGEG